VSEVYVNLSPILKSSGTLLYDFAWYINSGRIGVAVFFAISGFVILKSIKGDKISGTKIFLIKRFFRLYPAFWLSIFLWSLVMILRGEQTNFEQIIANITMLPLLFNQDMLLELYWTLETELIFYFLCLLIFYFTLSSKPINLFIISLFFLIVFAITNHFHLLINEQHPSLRTLPFHLSLMFWGALFRLYFESKREYVLFINRKISIKNIFILLTIMILFIPIVALIKGYLTNEFKLFQMGLAYILAIATFLLLSTIFKIKNKFLVWIGKISYSMYLFHPIVFYSLFWLLQNKLPEIFSNQHLSIYIIVNVMLSILVSAIVYYIIEKPSINIGNKLAENIKSHQ